MALIGLLRVLLGPLGRLRCLVISAGQLFHILLLLIEAIGSATQRQLRVHNTPRGCPVRRLIIIEVLRFLLLIAKVVDNDVLVDDLRLAKLVLSPTAGIFLLGMLAVYAWVT